MKSGFFGKKLKAYDDGHNFTCDICGREVFDGLRTCEKCRGELPYTGETICPFCGRKLKEAGPCLDCKEIPLGVEKARSLCTHEGEARRLVVRYKRGQKYLFRTLAELLLPLAKREFPDADLLVGVPMTERAVKKRGYNQAELLCARLAELWGKPCAAPAVKRRDTSSQKFLSRRERATNLEGCFHVADRKAVKGKTVVIIDDTMTTGATITEFAAVLKRAGAAKLYALTFTSVSRKDPFGKLPVGTN